MKIVVKRIKNVGQFGEYPALKNIQTGKIQAPPLRFVERWEAIADGFNIGRTTKNGRSLHTISQQLRSEGYSEIAISKVTSESGSFYIFYVKHPAINP